MSEKVLEEKIRVMIKKIGKLGWVQLINGEPYLHLADVEKTIFALFDKDYMNTIDKWAEEKQSQVKKR